MTLIERARAEQMLRIVLTPSQMSVPFNDALGFPGAQDLRRLDV